MSCKKKKPKSPLFLSFVPTHSQHALHRTSILLSRWQMHHPWKARAPLPRRVATQLCLSAIPSSTSRSVRASRNLELVVSYRVCAFTFGQIQLLPKVTRPFVCRGDTSWCFLPATLCLSQKTRYHFALQHILRIFFPCKLRKGFS
jgi:hypothetical protein